MDALAESSAGQPRTLSMLQAGAAVNRPDVLAPEKYAEGPGGWDTVSGCYCRALPAENRSCIIAQHQAAPLGALKGWAALTSRGRQTGAVYLTCG